jgi:hypothetical protein
MYQEDMGGRYSAMPELRRGYGDNHFLTEASLILHIPEHLNI